ncbi:MAG: hypothetical protein RI564_06465 [Gracilimonas sp.]|nr:hypothetical protein [Gracilimonas sp.]
MYIVNTKRQVERINEMITLRKNMETFEVYYHDPSTGKLWKSFFPRGYKQHKGPKLLRVDPPPSSMEHQLHLCLNSPDDGDAIGLGIEWSVKPEKWQEILELLHKNRKRYQRANLNTFINHLGVLKPRQSLHEIDVKPMDIGLQEEDLNELTKKARYIKLKRFFRL